MKHPNKNNGKNNYKCRCKNLNKFPYILLDKLSDNPYNMIRYNKHYMNTCKNRHIPQSILLHIRIYIP